MKASEDQGTASRAGADLAASAESGDKEPSRGRFPRMKRPSLAAYLAVIAALVAAIAAVVALPAPITPSRDDVEQASTASDARYEEEYPQVIERKIDWPEEWQTAYEKYSNIYLDDRGYCIGYSSRCREVPESCIDKCIGTWDAYELDPASDERRTITFNVYSLKNVAPRQVVAMLVDNTYYAYECDLVTSARTLGELMEQVDLPSLVMLNRFSENGARPTDAHFSLDGDAFIWEVLADCKDVPLMEGERPSWLREDYLCFSVTSDALGAYRRTLVVTRNGYLWTNALNRPYLFDIGEKEAYEIIDFAEAHSAKAEYEPYQNAVFGRIVEVADGRLVVEGDDATYIVPLDDLRISRYIDSDFVRTGDAVQVVFEGGIDEGGAISGAVSLARAALSPEDEANRPEGQKSPQ